MYSVWSSYHTGPLVILGPFLAPILPPVDGSVGDPPYPQDSRVAQMTQWNEVV